MAIEEGTRVRGHYKGTLKDGEQFDSSYERGEPIEFEVGKGSVISGFDEAVSQMEQGEKAQVTIPPENAYGERQEGAVQQIPKDRLPEEAGEGDMLTAVTPDGQQLAATVAEIKGEEATLDFNHPLAGEELEFELELVEIDGEEDGEEG
jgi:FKBP-type peptidyl-prolyl cis-trans isomerase 2